MTHGQAMREHGRAMEELAPHRAPRRKRSGLQRSGPHSGEAAWTKPSGVIVNNDVVCSPEGIRTPDLFLERIRLQKSDLEASTPRIVQKWELVDAPDGPNRASEKRPSHLSGRDEA